MARIPNPPPSHSRPVVAKIWRACAGSSVQFPTVHSRVYYFPQGHFEHSSSPPQFISSQVLSQPMILCTITAVQFLADRITDEVFAKLVLQPINHPQTSTFLAQDPSGLVDIEENKDDDDDDKIVSFTKILTPSDANNGGGFSVPRFCADAIFPPLNYQADPPVQTLSITDVHGVVWDFRHIYRGTPRRHLLTTGWSKFVTYKKLVAGDSVVYIKNLRGDMFVGIRRVVRSSGNSGNCSRWVPSAGGVSMQVEDAGREGFSRSGKGKLEPEAVMKAAELAAQNTEFEVVYYPKAGWSEFVVKAEIVDEALSVFWTAGTRVKMSMETEDLSRTTWFQGTVSLASMPEKGPWRGSPWRMLEVNWDEPEVLQNANRVSPWQVEYVTAVPPPHALFRPAKKLRGLQNSGVLSDAELFFPIKGLSNSTVGQFSSSPLNYNTFPAGMQGARQNIICTSMLFEPFHQKTPRMCIDNSFCDLNVVPTLIEVSTNLNIGGSPSDELSSKSQGSISSSTMELEGNPSCNCMKVEITPKNFREVEATQKSAMKVDGSFRLFGQVIHLKEPIESRFSVGGCTGDDVSKGCNETNDQFSIPFLDMFRASERLAVDADS